MKSLFLLLTVVIARTMAAQSFNSVEVHPDGSVTFRLKAPEAHEVKLDCESLGAAPMQKDGEGVWSYTTKSLEPDFYGYDFVVDQLRAMDLDNPLMKYNLLFPQSMVHVPGPASLPWEVNDVPHGIIHRHFYKSAAAGDERAWFVYTPPGYKPSGKDRYPVLYLLHGYSDDASAWWSVGQANIILDNLIARKQAKPMIVVMPLGYGTMDIVLRGWAHVREPGNWKRNVDKFRDALLNEVLPQVEENYRVLTKRQDRAIAGLSMGGAESLTVGLNDLDQFAWIGAFSSGGLGSDFATHFPKLDAGANDRLRLLWVSCGKEDGLFHSNNDFVEWLKSKGVHYNWTEMEGEHSWRVWRRNLAEFVPLLFQ